MGRPRKTPSEFPSDWHYERRLEDLAREIQGYKLRIADLETLPESPDRDITLENEKSGLKAAKSELDNYTGPRKSSRPAKAQSTR